MKLAMGLALCALTAAVSTCAVAEDGFDQRTTASKWKTYIYNPGGMAFNSSIAYLPGGTGFQFLSRPDTALLGTDHPSYVGDLLGDLSGSTITVTVQIEGDATFSYYGGSGGTPPTARLYFSTKDNTYDYGQTPSYSISTATRYWWSHELALDLSSVQSTGTATLTAHIDPQYWSDWDGKMATQFGNELDPTYSYTDAFLNAASKVDFIGLSFGGGSFFENGVGVTSGRATFKLISFTVTRP